MKTAVRESSIEAYHNFPAKPRQISKVYEYICKRSGCTRREIAHGTGYDVSAVSGRVNELIKVGLVREGDESVRCMITGKMVMALYPAPQQRELFA